MTRALLCGKKSSPGNSLCHHQARGTGLDLHTEFREGDGEKKKNGVRGWVNVCVCSLADWCTSCCKLLLLPPALLFACSFRGASSSSIILIHLPLIAATAITHASLSPASPSSLCSLPAVTLPSPPITPSLLSSSPPKTRHNCNYAYTYKLI